MATTGTTVAATDAERRLLRLKIVSRVAQCVFLIGIAWSGLTVYGAVPPVFHVHPAEGSVRSFCGWILLVIAVTGELIDRWAAHQRHRIRKAYRIAA